jgi:hypothetical protein
MLVLLTGVIFLTTPLKWAQGHDMHTKFHEDWLRHSKVIGDTHTNTQTAR